jgi:hypothetical protein
MNARARLASLYEEWRLMTESEGDAIRSLSWSRIEHCQHVKAGLKERILETIEAADGPASAEKLHRELRPVLEHLISLELRNSEWLEAGRLKLEAEQAGLNRHRRVVQQLQGSYGSRVW